MEFDLSYKGGLGLGKVIFGLVDIPINKKFKTTNGSFIERVDAYTIMVEGSIAKSGQAHDSQTER